MKLKVPLRLDCRGVVRKVNSESHQLQFGDSREERVISGAMSIAFEKAFAVQRKTTNKFFPATVVPMFFK